MPEPWLERDEELIPMCPGALPLSIAYFVPLIDGS
jgi:hypothetical protein